MCRRATHSVLQQSVSRTLWVSAAALLLGSPAALADEAPNLLTNPFQVALGTYIVETEPTVQLNGETSVGSEVDFDEALGGGDATRVRLDSHWRFGDSRRHKIKAIAFSVNRDNRRKLEEEIEWGGETYPVNAQVDAEFKFSVLEVAYEYAFLRRDNYEVNASAGLHYTAVEASLSAQAETSGGTLTEDISNSGSVDLPLPVFGLRGVWNLTHDFWLDATAQYFALSIDQYDGSLQDYRLMVTWQPSKWLGIGLGYNHFKVDVDVDADKFNGSLDWTYSGPMIFYSASF